MTIYSQDYLTALYGNDIKAVEGFLNNSVVSTSQLLAKYIQNTDTLLATTIEYLFSRDAELDIIIKDIQRPQSVFRSTETIPHPALIRLLKDDKRDIIDLLARHAELRGYASNFYYGSYSLNGLGSNGIMGAALSSDYQASVAMVSYLWSKASKYYQSNDLVAYRYVTVIALTDNIDAVRNYINSGSNPDIFWKDLIDYQSIKSIKYLQSIKANKMFLFNGRPTAADSYAHQLGYSNIVSILRDTI